MSDPRIQKLLDYLDKQIEIQDLASNVMTSSALWAVKQVIIVNFLEVPPDPTQIQQLIIDSHATAIEKGWWEEPKSFGECIALGHSEFSEALEEYRNHHEPNEVYFVNGKPEGVPIELADVLIRIFDLCGHYNINLDAAIKTKMAYNKTREHRHGGKAL